MVQETGSEAELRKPPKTSAEEQLLDYFLWALHKRVLVSNFTYKRKQQAARGCVAHVVDVSRRRGPWAPTSSRHMEGELSTALWYREATAQLADGNTRNTNRLAKHLRDTPACAATLRAHRMFAEVPAPGFGSRGWRKEAVDNFHPAVPQQQDQGLEAQMTDDWDDTQKAAHLALCEVLLGDDLPATAEEIAALLKTTVTRFPLYEDEAKHLLDFVHQEAREVHNELIDHGWTSNTEQEVTAAVESLLSAPWHADDQIPRRDAQVFTYEDIFTTVSETNWSEIWTATREVHGTPEVVQYELEPSWEADLRASCRAIDVSAVHNHLLPVVPRALRDVWDTVLSGGVPRLSAPCSFWQHSAAAPFAPFAAHSASN